MNNNKNYTITTLGSHSALQILKGAKDEGFKTLCVCISGREKPYRMFNVADKIITIDTFDDFSSIDNKLKTKKIILIPHASLIAYLGADKVKMIKMKYFGNKKILEWESDRKKERKWLKKAKLNLPKLYENYTKIDRPVIVKFDGADGGEGYFLAKNEAEFVQKAKKSKKAKYFIQEYIIGVPIYAHFFYSCLSGGLELMGFDRRYESNVDCLGRILAKDQLDLDSLNSSYLVCGNFPIVIRESFLPEIIDMGERVVKASQEIAPPGLFGPFCLELIISPDKKIVCFEISARIVAGTNPYISGSPYTDLIYNEPMSTGRRIAREIKNAIELDKLNLILS